MPTDPSDSELLTMFADVICPALRDLLVAYGASDEHWNDAANQLRRIAVRLAALDSPAA